eukprot:scaffold9979_cov31-Phaeocystis_antarctica.AAC.1
MLLVLLLALNDPMYIARVIAGGNQARSHRTPRTPPSTLDPTPYTLHPTPYTPHPTPYTLHPTPPTPHTPPLAATRRSTRRRSSHPNPNPNPNPNPIPNPNQALYAASVLGQICFSGGLFMFWLVYADGMQTDP